MGVGTVVFGNFDAMQARDAMGNYIKQVDAMLGNKPDRKAYGYLCLGFTTQPGDMRRAAVKAGDGPPDDTYSHMQEVSLFMLVSSRAVAKERIISLYYTRNQVEELRTPYLFRGSAGSPLLTCRANAGADGKLENRFVDSFTKYTEVEKLTAEIVTDVLQEIIIYPGRRLNIVWNYRDEMEKLLLDINMGDGAGNTED